MMFSHQMKIVGFIWAAQVVAHGQKDITSLVSLVRIKVFEVDGGGGAGGRGEGGGKGS